MALTKIIGSGIGTVTNQFADGNMSSGSVLQVVQTVYTGTATYSHSATSGDITGLSVAITPSSTSSKILIDCHITYTTTTDGCGNVFQLLRGSSQIGGGTGGSSFQGFIGLTNNHGQSNSPGLIQTVSGNFLDSPSTTSETTYKIRHQGVSGASPIIINRNESDTIAAISTITATEVAG
tara:strand:+ start:73 stop:609 length:537 start_codon:yes stop_codon:yes gene_type:complete